MVKVSSFEDKGDMKKIIFSFDPNISPIQLLEEIELRLYEYFDFNGYDYDIEEIDEDEIVISAWSVH